MIQKNDLFDYGTYIFQNTNYFKFSIDSILLAEFVSFKSHQMILDMCNGNAPIPLILSTKDDTLKIDAVEIQKEVFDLAKRSIEHDGYKNINLVNADIKDYRSKLKYDIVICNPPFFKVDEHSILNGNIVKRIARHEVAITLKEVIEIAKKNLNENGKFYIVNRTNRFLETINELQNKRLGIRKICFIYTKDNREAEFFMIESEQNKKDDPKISSINIKGLKTYKNIFKE